METDEGNTHRRVESLRARLASGRHLQFDDEIAPYIDGRLDDEMRREVEAHLRNCDVCRREMNELREFVAPSRGTRWIAALAAAAAVVFGVTVLMRRSPAPAPAPVVVHTQPLVIALRDGKRTIGVDARGSLHGLALDAATAQRAASLLAHPDLAAPATLASLIAPARELRGETTSSNDLVVLSPIAMAVVDDRPQFTWRGSLDAHYEIAVGEEVRGETTGNHWTPPTPLPRGRTYTWQVSTTINGQRVIAPAPPAPPALFRVVDEKTAEAIRSAQSHLVAGMLAYEAGAIADARREFEQLAAENPASPVPAKLIASCDRAARLFPPAPDIAP